MGTMASQITSLTIVYSTIYSDEIKENIKASKLRVTGLCAGNSPVTGEFPAQMASNAENVSIWWRHHDMASWCNGTVHYHRVTHILEEMNCFHNNSEDRILHFRLTRAPLAHFLP